MKWVHLGFIDTTMDTKWNMLSDRLSIASWFDSTMRLSRDMCISIERYGIGDINDIQPIGLKQIGSPSICRCTLTRFRCILFYRSNGIFILDHCRDCRGLKPGSNSISVIRFYFPWPRMDGVKSGRMRKYIKQETVYSLVLKVRSTEVLPP